MRQCVFVYGTLRPAAIREELRYLIDMLKPVGRGLVRGRLYDLGEYPGAVLDASDGMEIIGDLLEFAGGGQILNVIDEYEGYLKDDDKASLFIRSKCLVTSDEGCEIESWIYIYNRDVSSARLISTGDYLDARSSKEGFKANEDGDQRG